MIIFSRLKTMAIGLLLCGTLHADTKDDIELLKQNTERWIILQQKIAQDRNQWKSEKEILGHSIDALQSSKEDLEYRINLKKASYTNLLEERDTFTKTLDEQTKGNQFLEDYLTQYEQRVLKLVKRLPDPLKEHLTPFVLKIPTGSTSVKPGAANRIQNLLTILTFVDDFNKNIKFTHVIKPLDDGTTTDVKVLYWGIAFGYASGVNGQRAWFLEPGDETWVWKPRDEHALSIKGLFDVYEKFVDPVLIEVPASIQKREESE